MSARAPSFGRGCRAQRGGVGFLFCGEAASSLPSLSGKGGPRQQRSGALANDVLETISPLFFIPLVPYPPLRGTFPSRGRLCIEKSGIPISQPSPLGKGNRAAVDRVLSYIACLRRSFPLSFMPLEPYPVRSARHLPHAGKALFVVILFLHVSCIRFDEARKAVFSFRCLPHWGRGTASAVDRVLSQTAHLRRSFPLFFIPLSPSNLRPFGAPPSIGRRE